MKKGITNKNDCRIWRNHQHHHILFILLFWMGNLTYDSYAIAQHPAFIASELDFIYNSQSLPPVMADVDGDQRDELVRFNETGIYLDSFPKSGGRYTQHTALNLSQLPKWSTVAGDIDKNGLVDFILGADQNVILLQQYNRTYNELILPGSLVSQRANLLDLDKDGDLDVFVCNDEGENYYYENDGNGSFHQSQVLSSLSKLAGNYSSIWSDINGDGRLDLYISKCFANVPPSDERRKNVLYIQQNDGQFKEEANQRGVADTAQTWTTSAEDFDNDGDIDLYVLNHDMANRLYRNNGDGSFTDVISHSGLDAYDYGAFEVVTGDFNNDGYIDILTDQNHSLFLGKGDLSFENTPTQVKAGAVGDINGDGFLDVFNDRMIFENTKNQNHWIKFKLNGIWSNTNGIGARIVIYANGKHQLRELRAGQGYGAMSGLHIHFGLGQENHIDSVRVLWPSGITTTVLNLAANACHEITECDGHASVSKPETKDSLMCISPMIVRSPTQTGIWLWSNGDSSHTISVIQPGIYTAFKQEGNGCWQAEVRYRIQMENNSPPTFLRDSILPHPCQGNEVRLPWYKNSDIVHAHNWEEKNYLYVNQDGSYVIEKSLSCQPGQKLYDTLDLQFTKVDKPTVDSTHWTQDSVTFYSSDPNTLWYKNDQTEQPLAQGPLYTGYIPFLYNKVFFEAFNLINDVVQSGGRKDAKGSFDVFPNRDLYFSVKETMHLQSVDMYVLKKSSEGNRHITLTNQIGELIAEYTTNLQEGLNRLSLDIMLQKGHYKLSCDRSDQAMNAGDYNYPYPLSNLGSIDSCTGKVNFYPYFYNWKFSGSPQLCKSERNVFIWLSTEDEGQGDGILIYPNPANEYINVDQGKNEIISYSILQIDGRYVAEGAFNQKDSIIITDFSPGFYVLLLKTRKGKIITKKVAIF